MIRNIIFDMGNVLIYFDTKAFIDRLGISDPADKALLNREVFLSLEWGRMDRGSLTDTEAAEIMCSRVPERLHDTVYKLATMWDRPILPVPGMYELVKELKDKGYGIYLLSNASTRQHEYWGRIPASKFFDGTLISADVKLVKPEAAIYSLLLEQFSLKKEECFFIDDSVPNVEGAFFCDIKGAVFHNDVSEIRRLLRGAGVNVSEQLSGCS